MEKIVNPSPDSNIRWQTQQQDSGPLNKGDIMIDSGEAKFSIDKRELPRWWYDAPEKQDWWVQEYFAEYLQFTEKAIKILSETARGTQGV